MVDEESDDCSDYTKCDDWPKIRAKMLGDFRVQQDSDGKNRIIYAPDVLNISAIDVFPPITKSVLTASQAKDLCSTLNSVFYNHLADEEPISQELVDRLRAQIKDIDDPLRYVVYNRIGEETEFFYDVKTDCYAREPYHGTLFKRLEVARCVAGWLNHRDEDRFLVAEGTLAKGDFIITTWGV